MIIIKNARNFVFQGKCVYLQKQIKDYSMKNFMIIYRIVKNGKTLEGITSANKMLNALTKAENLCNTCKANGILKEVVSITEIVG